MDVGRTMTVAEDEAGNEAEEKIRAIKRLHNRLHRHPVLALVTKVVITVIGLAVIVVGVVLSGPGIPGPGLVVIVFGLAILATEWSWAERLLKRAKRMLDEARRKAREMDPAVRRRRVLIATALTVVVGAAVVGYLWYYDWPSFAVAGWDRVQSFSDAVPELPGM